MPMIRDLVTLPPGFFDDVLRPSAPPAPAVPATPRTTRPDAPTVPTVGDADTRPVRPMARRRVTSSDLYGSGGMGDARNVRASDAPYNVAREYGRRPVTRWHADDVRPRPSLNRL